MTQPLPNHLWNYDPQAVSDSAQIPQWFKDATSPHPGTVWPPTHQYTLFTKAVELGFVPQTEAGFATVLYWNGVSKAQRLQAGLTEFQTFLDLFYGAHPSNPIPTPTVDPLPGLIDQGNKLAQSGTMAAKDRWVFEALRYLLALKVNQP